MFLTDIISPPAKYIALSFLQEVNAIMPGSQRNKKLKSIQNNSLKNTCV